MDGASTAYTHHQKAIIEKFVVKNRRQVFLLSVKLWASLFQSVRIGVCDPSFHSGYLDVLLQKKNYMLQ
jgi:hypothetical protein